MDTSQIDTTRFCVDGNIINQPIPLTGSSYSLTAGYHTIKLLKLSDSVCPTGIDYTFSGTFVPNTLSYFSLLQSTNYTNAKVTGLVVGTNSPITSTTSPKTGLLRTGGYGIKR